MGTPAPLSYNRGDQSKGGTTIAFIFGQSPDVIVFSDVSGGVHWEMTSDSLAPAQLQAHNEYDRLNAVIRSNVAKAKRRVLIEELACALFLGLCSLTPEHAKEHFTAVGTRIRTEALVHARLQYVVSGTLAAVIAVVLAQVTASVSPLAAESLVPLSCTCGALGAWTSVLQRASRLAVRPFEPLSYLAFQGTTRILLGSVFGGFLVGAVKAGLILSVAASNGWAVAAFAFIAGFSERYVPELIRGLDHHGNEVESGARREDAAA